MQLFKERTRAASDPENNGDLADKLLDQIFKAISLHLRHGEDPGDGMSINGWEAMGIKLGDPYSRDKFHVTIDLSIFTAPDRMSNWMNPDIICEAEVTTRKG